MASYLILLLAKWAACSAIAEIHYAARYASKTIQRVSIIISSKPRKFENIDKGVVRQNYAPSQQPNETRSGYSGEKLAKFLHIDILTLISNHMHYADLINLSLTSKVVREAVFPSDDPERARKLLERNTCTDAAKADCWACSRQICDLCANTIELTHEWSWAHSEWCQPICTECYRLRLSLEQDKHGFGAISPCSECDCMQGGQSSPFHKKDKPSDKPDPPRLDLQRQLCNFCYLLPMRECIKIRQAREIPETKRLADQQPNCKSCRLALPSSGPRWWMCSHCGDECRSSIHPPWS